MNLESVNQSIYTRIYYVCELKRHLHIRIVELSKSSRIDYLIHTYGKLTDPTNGKNNNPPKSTTTNHPYKHSTYEDLRV